MKFELAGFIEECRGLVTKPESQSSISDLTEQAVSVQAAVLSELGEPTRGGLNTLYHAPDLTILNIVWAPGMTLHPHNHCMWAVIGIYGGEEENIFYRRDGSGLTQHGMKSLEAGNTVQLVEDIIHSVHNPREKLTGAIHVYGGDFFAAHRSEWMPDEYQEQPFSIEHTRAVFEEANKRMDSLV